MCVIIVGGDISEMKEFLRHVLPSYATKWWEIGVALGLPLGRLHIISTDHPNSCIERCREMLCEWLRQEPSPTWGKLADAIALAVLSSTIVGGKFYKISLEFFIEITETSRVV